jgi:hypothetical protein
VMGSEFRRFFRRFLAKKTVLDDLILVSIDSIFSDSQRYLEFILEFTQEKKDACLMNPIPTLNN